MRECERGQEEGGGGAPEESGREEVAREERGERRTSAEVAERRNENGYSELTNQTLNVDHSGIWP